MGRGKRKDGSRSADEERWGMSRAELEKRIPRSTRAALAISLPYSTLERDFCRRRQTR
jgi:hypothetical protein